MGQVVKLPGIWQIRNLPHGAKPFDRRALFLEEPPGVVLLALETRFLGVPMAAILLDQLPLLDRQHNNPNQMPRRASVNAHIAVGAGLVAEHGHFGLGRRAQHDDRLFGPAGAIAFDQIQGVKFARLMADENGVVDFLAEPLHPGRLAGDFFKQDFGRAVGRKGFGQPRTARLTVEI